jgi:hypothetical protein
VKFFVLVILICHSRETRQEAAPPRTAPRHRFRLLPLFQKEHRRSCLSVCPPACLTSVALVINVKSVERVSWNRLRSQCHTGLIQHHLKIFSSRSFTTPTTASADICAIITTRSVPRKSTETVFKKNYYGFQMKQQQTEHQHGRLKMSKHFSGRMPR